MIRRFRNFAAILAVLVFPACLHAQIVAHPGDDLQSKLDLAQGGTLTFAAGNFDVIGPLVVHARTTLQGAAGMASHIKFTLFGGDLYGFAIEANAHDVTITGLDIQSSNGVMKLMDGQAYSNIHFIANNVQYGGGTLPNGNYVFGIDATIPCDDLEITWNYFHDSPKTVRNWEIWGEKNSHVDHNLFYDVFDGGHFLEPTLNNTFSWNYGTHLGRMGQEIQGSMHDESGLICDHDVFYDFVNAYNDTEGMSVCPNFTTGVVVSNGYFRNNLIPGSSFGTMTGGAVGGPNRFGYALEAIAPGIVFQNDTIILANLSADAIASGETTTVNNCTVYGGNNALWGVWGPDFGPDGQKGTFTLGSGSLANTVNATLDGAPPPPPNTFAGPSIYFATNHGQGWTPAWTPPAQQGAAPAAPAQTGTAVASNPPPTPVHTITVMSDGSLEVK
jgi:hypothetical protein